LKKEKRLYKFNLMPPPPGLLKIGDKEVCLRRF